MKALFALIAAACVGGTVLAQQPQSMPAPSPENQKLAVWYGDWMYTGETQTTPLGPGGKFAGSMTGRPVQDGHAGEFVYNESGPTGETRYIEIDFWDPAQTEHAYVFLGNDGYVERGSFTMKKDTTSFEGSFVAKGKPYRVRGIETVAADGQSYTRKAELCVSGNRWVPFSETKFTKVIAAPASTEEQSLLQLERDWAAAYVAADVATLDRIEADSFTFIDHMGNLQAKAEGLGEVRSKTYAATSFQVDDMKVRLFGDSAIVTGRTTEKSTYKGEDTSGIYRWTDTWIKQNGTWRCAASQASRVPEKS